MPDGVVVVDRVCALGRRRWLLEWQLEYFDDAELAEVRLKDLSSVEMGSKAGVVELCVPRNTGNMLCQREMHLLQIIFNSMQNKFKLVQMYLNLL